MISHTPAWGSRGRAVRWIGLGLSLCLMAQAAWAAPPAVSADLIRLHDQLRLDERQESSWRDYTTAIAPSPEVQARHRATEELLPLVPTPRRIALIEAAMAQDRADFRRQGEAVKAFYAQLTPSQQRIFDLETLPSTSAAPAVSGAPNR